MHALHGLFLYYPFPPDPSPSLRGQNSFFTLFAEEQSPAPALPQGEGMADKGRCPELNARRNQAILDRYFYYGKYTGLRYNLIIARISSEFFLSERRVTDVISASTAYLQQLRKTPVSIAELRRKYPHLVWVGEKL